MGSPGRTRLAKTQCRDVQEQPEGVAGLLDEEAKRKVPGPVHRHPGWERKSSLAIICAAEQKTTSRVMQAAGDNADARLSVC